MIVNCQGKPLEVLLLKAKELGGLVNGIENDFPISKASKGLFLDLSSLKNKFQTTKEILDLEQEYFVQCENDIRSKENVGSEKPLVEGCQCYTCQNFSRGYLHHLVEMQEMNGQSLLAMHNLH